MAANRVSVALCTYNGTAFLEDQLRSIRDQVRPPDELVVCDDRSTDGTVELVRAFAADAPFPVRIEVNAENLGSTANFEKAIGLCTGDLIALSDQDDVWHENKLRDAEQVLQRSPHAGAVFSDADVVDDQLQPLGRRMWDTLGFDPQLQQQVRDGGAFTILMRRQIVTGATLCFRASYRDLILPIPAGVVHDGWIALLIAATADLALLDRPLVLYRQHESNQIGAKSTGLTRWLERERWQRMTRVLLMDLIRFSHAYERLKHRGCRVRDEGVYRELEDKVGHLVVRRNLPGSRLRRVPAVFSEWTNGRYSHHSNGLPSALKDLLL